MRIYEMSFTSEELPVMRDALIEEYQRLKAHARTVAQPSENLTKRLAMLQGLKETFSAKCIKSR